MDIANVLWEHQFGSQEDGYAIFSLERGEMSLLAINNVARDLFSVGEAMLDAIDVQSCLEKVRLTISEIGQLDVDGDALVRRLERHQAICSLRKLESGRYAILSMIRIHRSEVQRLTDEANSAAMAQWTASISHELSQPIHVIQNAVSIIEMRRNAGTDTAEAIKPCLDLLQDASASASETIATLKEAVSPWFSNLKKWDLVVLIEDFVSKFNATLDSWIEFQRPDAPFHVMIDRVQFDVLLASLLVIFRTSNPNQELSPKVTIEFDADKSRLELRVETDFALQTQLFGVSSKQIRSSVTLESCKAIASANSIVFKVLSPSDNPSACIGFQLSMQPHGTGQSQTLSRRFARRLWD
ncbi:sensor histidine kinase [Rubripirellula reticaptiva]|uniref:histidine kinase n=1 Tax=Rubripirellula reticaptiva TaxID=2528013 RepID=A0A5C6ETH2_9BACT|nr:HAMP domain-containing histidine kinase [Rubripirellula reticaptiva]TWU51610.1 hypothetical protein Poly59_32030 [Rubripirellula reticaptiva]